jgi:hypothetical protein
MAKDENCAFNALNFLVEDLVHSFSQMRNSISEYWSQPLVLFGKKICS